MQGREKVRDIEVREHIHGRGRMGIQGKVKRAYKGQGGEGGKVGERGNEDIARDRVADSKLRVGL